MKVEQLKPSQRVKGRFLLHMEDGTILRVGENEVISVPLYAGMDLSETEIEALKQSAHHSGLKEKALNLLSRKPLSRKELERKLREWEATDEEIESIATRMEELNFLNDVRYAEIIVRHYTQKGYGEQKLKAELSRRGIPREHWEDALEQKTDNSNFIDQFIAKKLKGEQPDPKSMKKVSDALIRRGFGWSEVKDALNRYGTEVWED